MSTAYTAPPPNPAAAGSNPYQQTIAPSNTAPGLAFLLGLIPGVGAIYNGQYAKGLVHAAIIGLLLSVMTSIEGAPGIVFIAMLLTGFWGYMAFEAFHTAKQRQLGLPVDEFSSLISPAFYSSRLPIGPLVLIVLGVLFLLDTLNLLAFRNLARFWPVILIVAGCVMLFNRLTGLKNARPMESGHER